MGLEGVTRVGGARGRGMDILGWSAGRDVLVEFLRVGQR